MNQHTFHVPVMGIAYTVDTPVKVAHLGIDSVVSLVDDFLLEKLRKIYCMKYSLPYTEITDKIEDFRAERITSYLNLLHEVAEKKYEEIKSSASSKMDELREYMGMLPDSSAIKQEFKKFSSKRIDLNDIKTWVKNNLSMGSIDVNIMTKIDKENYLKGEKLPSEFNDAHAALRGYANSKLNSSVILSAGLNPRLYAYIENFKDFHPDSNGNIRKRIALKVSDFKSALIQGKYLAKKGLWVSEFRIESGLNCGGHAFATEGHLLGPILAEFKERREELVNSMHELFATAQKAKKRYIPASPLQLKVTAQGGVGTADEHQFLMENYQLDSVGWGSPFLLVPEATTVDATTLKQLEEAEEKDLYLSDISPLGLPFNSLRGNTKDLEKLSLIKEGKPGSACPRKFVALNTEFSNKGICTASRHYQNKKLKELDAQPLSGKDYMAKFNRIVEKSCICVGLGTPALLENQIDTKREGKGVSVCPGPNLAYFTKKMSLKDITDHIYGRKNMISRTDRPNMFMKELNMYVDYLKKKVKESDVNITLKQQNHLLRFGSNLDEGVDYYFMMYSGVKDMLESSRASVLEDLQSSRKAIRRLMNSVRKLPLSE